MILGPMGAGKTTTATALATALGRPHRDSDDDITARGEGSGRELAEQYGVAHLHRLEADVLLDALAQVEPQVISGAGSVIEDARCRRALREAAVFVLELPIDELVERIATGGHRRPMTAAELERVAERRAPLLAEVTTATLDATMSTDALVRTILRRLGPDDAGVT